MAEQFGFVEKSLSPLRGTKKSVEKFESEGLWSKMPQA